MTRVAITITNRTELDVSFFLNGGTGATASLGAGQRGEYSLLVDPGVPPIVGIFQLDGQRLDFTVSNDGNYKFVVENGQIVNSFA